MFKNYLKIAFRNIKRHKGYSFINIFGLAVGMAFCILIILWVQDEFSYNQFHENRDNLYIVGTHSHYGNQIRTSAGTPPALGPVLKAEYPEIMNSARFVNGFVNMVIKFGDKLFTESVRAADPSVLEMFTFPLVKGNPKTVLSNPHSIILTESMAEKYFGNEDPIGKVVTIDNTFDFTVTGILQNMAHNTTINFDFLVSIEFFKEYWGLNLEKWSNFAYNTYVQLQQNASYQAVNQKIVDRIKKEQESNSEAFLYPYKNMYLHGLGTGGGHIGQVRIFSLIALFVILIACINFMNLTTARSGTRATEIGMRKVAGAHKKDIIKQFFSESIVISFISLFIAIILVYLLLPIFNDISGKQLQLNFSSNTNLIFGLIGVAFFTGIIAGSYPALFMARFQPVKILKGSFGFSSKGSQVRKILVVMQFAISICLIIATIIIYNQLNFMRNKDLGFNKESLIYVNLNKTIRQHYEAAKLELQQHSNIKYVSLISFSPTGVYSNDDGYDWDGKSHDTNPSIWRFCTDTDFLKTFEGKMVQGEFYKKELMRGSSDVSGKVVINEAFAEIMGMENPVGARLSLDSNHFTISGIVKDFNFRLLYNAIEPMAIYYQTENSQKSPLRYRYIFMKIEQENVQQTIEHVKKVYEKFSQGYPFAYRFLANDYDQLYGSERDLCTIIKYCTILTIMISCLGLFGLASFMTEQRTKEIGVRKVLGASVPGIVILLSKEFTKWVLIANIIAWPSAYFLMKNWLQDFAYRINLGWHIFVLSAILTLVIALLTVSYQAIRAAVANPVKSLRYE